MTEDWRRLLQCFVSDSIGAAAFHDRFLEAWRTARDRADPEPQPIADLFYVVEAYCPDPSLQGPYDATELELRAAAEQTLVRLG